MKVRIELLTENEKDHERIWGWTCLVVIGGMLVWLEFLGPPPVLCTFHHLTGYPCPSCGSTRAFVSLIEGDLLGSFQMNPLAMSGFLCALGYVLYALIVSHLRLPRIRIVWDPSDFPIICAVASIAVLATWSFLILEGR